MARSKTTISALSLLATAAILGALPAVLAHGDDEGEGMPAPQEDQKLDSYPPTYFSHPEHQGVMYAHIVLMVLGWVFVLPIGEQPFRNPLRSRLLN